MVEPSPGQLVVFEGIDGVGKSSVAAGLVQRLRADGVNAAFVSRDVVAASAAAACRLRSLADLLWGYGPGVDLTALGDRHLILLMASWFALFDESALRPALLRHRIVVTDQSPRKYIARFLANGHEDVAPLFAGLQVADLVLHLDVDAATAAARKVSIRRTECGGRGEVTASNFSDFQQRVRFELLGMSDASWSPIDAGRDLCDVVDAAATVTRARCSAMSRESHL